MSTKDHSPFKFNGFKTSTGFVLAELLAVVFVMSLMVLVVMLSYSSFFGSKRIKGHLQSFVSTMQMAANAASQSSRRYEVIINMTDQDYILRKISSELTADILEDEIVEHEDFSEHCRVIYIQFDDGTDSDGDFQEAKFRAGHVGWQYGGKIVFQDDNENIYSVVVKRGNNVVDLVEGNVELLIPRSEDEMFF